MKPDLASSCVCGKVGSAIVVVALALVLPLVVQLAPHPQVVELAPHAQVVMIALTPCLPTESESLRRQSSRS